MIPTLYLPQTRTVQLIFKVFIYTVDYTVSAEPDIASKHFCREKELHLDVMPASNP